MRAAARLKMTRVALLTLVLRRIYERRAKSEATARAVFQIRAGARIRRRSYRQIQTALATIQADVTAIKSRVNALPTNTYSVPTVSEITTGVWGAATRTLTSATGGGATASEVWAYATRTLTASPTDTSNLAKSAEIAALQTHGDTNWATASGFATPADVTLTTTTETVSVTTQAVDLSSVTALLNKIHALLGDWAVSGTALTTTSGGYVLTKDTNGKITEVRPQT